MYGVSPVSCPNVESKDSLNVKPRNSNLLLEQEA